MESITKDVLAWWQDTFSDADREWMIATYSPLSMEIGDVSASAVERQPLVQLLTHLESTTAARHLSLLAPWFSKPGYQHCAIAFARKGLELLHNDMPVLDQHFAWMNQCISLYRWRDTEVGALEGAIAACEACIAIQEQAAEKAKKFFGFIPSHHCFRQLRIIEEKRGNFERALALCEEAKAGGWADDWDRDIARLRKKLQRGTRGANLSL